MSNTGSILFDPLYTKYCMLCGYGFKQVVLPVFWVSYPLGAGKNHTPPPLYTYSHTVSHKTSGDSQISRS